MKLSFRHSRAGFTLVELIIGMTIFAIGLTGIYALLSSTMGNATYSRHEIVVANLLREEMELVKNIRDTNVRNFLDWDRTKTDNSSATTFASGIYLIENNFHDSTLSVDQTTGNIQASPVYMRDITTAFSSNNTLENHFNQSKLILDDQGRYIHEGPGVTGTGTPYASYLIITPMQFIDTNGTLIKVEKNGKSEGYLIDARVIVNSRGVYREYDAKTAITNWIR